MARKSKVKSSAGSMATNSSTPFNRYLWLLAGAWVFPFLNPYHAYPLPDFYTECAAFTLGVVAMAALGYGRVWREGLWIPKVLFTPLLLGAVLLIQVVLNRVAYPETVWLAELYLLWVIGLIWLGAALRKQLGLEIIVRTLSWAVLSGGLTSALIGIVQYLHWNKYLGPVVAPYVSGAVYGNLAQSNHYANYLSVALVGLGYLFAKQRITRPWAMVCGVALMLGMALSGSRSTVLYVLVFAVLAHSLYWRSTDQVGKTLRIATLIALSGYAIILFGVMYAGMKIGSGHVAGGTAIPQPELLTGARFTEIGNAISPRLFLWNQAWHMFLSAPMLGVGWGEFVWQFFLHFSDFPNPGVPTIDPNAHNAVFHLLATTGLLGTLAVLAPLGIWAWRARSLQLSPEKWWLLCILAVQGIHGLLEYNLWYAQFLGMVALLLGLGETAEFRFAAIGRKWLGWAWLATLLLAAVLFAGVMQDYRTLEGWGYNGRSFNPRDPSGSTRRMRDDLLGLQKHSLFRPFVEMSHPELTVPASASPAEKLALDLRVMRFAPNSEIVYRHAMMLAANGEQDAAMHQLQRAIAVYPGDLGTFVQRIAILANNDPEKFGEISRVAQDKLNEASAVQGK